MSKAIDPGRPITVISALTGTRGAKLLEAIRTGSSQIYPRIFSDWMGNVARGEVRAGKNRVVWVTLRLDAEEGLFLGDADRAKVSMRAKAIGSVLRLDVGTRMGPRHLNQVAGMVVAAYVVHGFDWKDRSGRSISFPHGIAPQATV